MSKNKYDYKDIYKNGEEIEVELERETLFDESYEQMVEEEEFPISLLDLNKNTNEQSIHESNLSCPSIHTEMSKDISFGEIFGFGANKMV